jgi:polyisoprenoid-binding protein YceI
MRILILFLLFLIPASMQNQVFIIAEQEQLIIFTQKTNSEVNAVFMEEMLPQIKELASAEGISFIFSEIDEIAPRDVSYTPFIAFRNTRGTSYFSGRWNQMTKIKNFVRSSRVLHQGKEPNYKENILTWQNGRMNMIAPLKITELQGKLPKNYNADAFMKAAKAAIEEGTPNFNFKNKVNATLSTRSFYWAMYPYRDKKGRYSITAEIYSQYNCVDPIYTHFENPVVHKNLEKAFQQMAAILEEQVVYQLDNPKNGDGFGIVEAAIKSIPWNQFGKMEEKEKNDATQDKSLFESKKEWKVVGAFADNIPMIYFSFMQPLDGYTGEVKELNGELILESDDNLKNATGTFNIPITAITMGDDGLDKAIHTSILDGESYPNASFSFEKIENSQELSFSNEQKITIKGKMNLKGKSSPIITAGTIKPYVRDSKSYLHVNLSFNVDKSIFGVEKGPDGPDDIKENMVFYMNFLLL